MANERQYAAVEVVGRAGGMNQAGWEGAIADNECTMLYNMGTNIDGEWKKRNGYERKKEFQVEITTPPVAKLHWHTDEATDQTDATTWVETGNEITAASSGALDCNNVLTQPDSVTLDGEIVGRIYNTATTSAVGIKSSFNLDADAGRMTFWVNLAFDAYLPTAPHGWDSKVYSTTAVYPPTKWVYLFYGSANFYLYIHTSGDLIWKYGSGDAEYINAGPLSSYVYTKIDLRWDNAVAGTIYPYRFQIFVNGVSKGTADPASPVTLTFGTSVFFLNSAIDGTASPYSNGVTSGNWTFSATTYGMKVVTSLAAISTWSSSASAVVASGITGIHNNSSQQRAVITAGTAAPASGKIFYSPSWTLATETYAIAGVRTAATECQGNIYITDGTHHMHYLIGTGTATQVYELPETAKWIEEYHGHLCIAGLGTNGAYSVRLSTIDDFVTSSVASWPATNQIFKCRDTVRGIKAFSGSLIVGTRSTIEAISGYNPQDFTKTIVANAGCASHWSMTEVPLSDGTTSALIWAGYDGIYMLTQGIVTKISWGIQPFWDTLSKVEIEEAHAVDCRTRGEYMLAVSDGSVAENNYIIVFNYRKGSWAIWKYNTRMDVLGKYYRSGVEVILGGDTQGNLYELNLNDSDNSLDIPGYMMTKWHDGGLPDQEKDFRRLYVWAETSGGDYDIEVGWSVNYESTVTPGSIVIGTDGNDYVCTQSHAPDIVVGLDGNDYVCIASHTAGYLNYPGVEIWEAAHSYLNQPAPFSWLMPFALVTPTSPDGHIYQLTSGDISGDDEPTWDTTHGNTTFDGGCVWANLGAATASTYWAATGTTGCGAYCAVGKIYNSSSVMRPITGASYGSYWTPNNTVGSGTVWDSSAGYVASKVAMGNTDYLPTSGAAAVFGTAVFDTDVFSSGVQTRVFGVDLYGARGRSIQFMFRTSLANEPFKIRGYKAWFTYIPEFPA